MNQGQVYESLLRLSHRDGPYIQLELFSRSEVNAISPLSERVVHFIKRCRCAPGNEQDIEAALHEALVNAVVHGNHQDAEKQVYVSCRCGIGEVSIVIRDEGQGFDIDEVKDPTAPENMESGHGRGIYLMKTLMDKVRFERGGAVVYMRKSAGNPSIMLRKVG